jgi:hypothetical protein
MMHSDANTGVLVKAGTEVEENRMAIVMIHDVSDGTLAEYDQVIKELEATGHGHPPGRLSHVAARKGTATSSSTCGSRRRPSTASGKS